MYIYYKGLIIRKGNAGLPNDKVKELYVDAGWQKPNIPQWQHEKFQKVLENSMWVYTVWDQEELVGLIRVISDKIMFATLLDLIVKRTHRKRGVGTELVRLCLQKLPHGTWYAHT